jgi:hypothetical protein
LGIMWPKSGSSVFYQGAVAPGAEAYFFEAGTSTPLATYTDADLSVPHTHPVEADGNGLWPAVFLDFGSYKEVLKTSGGTTLFSADDIPNEAPTDPSDSVDPNAIFQTGDTIVVFTNDTRAGFVRCNGRSIGSAASSATERANADCEALFIKLWNGAANAQLAVSGGRGANAAADWAANKNIALPNCRSAALIGFDDMGNSAAGLAGSAPVVSGSAILAGSIIGENTHTLITGELASHTHAVNFNTGSASADHTHPVSISTSSDGAHTHTGTTSSDGAHTHNYDKENTNTVYAAGGAGGPVTTTTATATTSAGAHTHTFTTSSNGAHTHTVSGNTGNMSADHSHPVIGTSASTGSGTAHNVMQRSVPVTILIKL